MESQVLVVGGGHGASAVAQQQQHYGSRFPGGMERFSGVCPVPSSPGKQQQQQWQFRVEKRVALRPPKKTSAVEVRAKKSGLDFKLPGSLKLKKGDEPEDAKGTQKFGTAKLPGTKKLPGTLKLPGSQRIRRKDSNVVFVAGATGKVGRRVVRELVQLGYKVRAGVRDVEKAEFLVEFAAGVDKSVEEEEAAEEREEKPEAKEPNVWASFAPGNLFGFLGSAKKSRVDLVEVDLGVVETIEDAIGNAGVVVCAIGASEKEALNALAPYRIDFKATENLINAASDAKVKHFVLVTSLGTQKIGWPAALLNLFWGVLVWKAKAEKALISSGIPFTIVRPGGMERPTDAYKETHNLILDKADSRFGGQVSNLQVAELIAGIVSNLKLSQNKVLEVVAETTAPLRPIEDLLAEILSIDDIEAEAESSTQKIAAQKEAEEEETLAKRKEAEATKQREEEERFAKKEALKAAKQKEEEERLAVQERAAEEQAKTEALRKKLQKEYSQAKAQEDEAKKSAQAARLQKEDIEKRVAELRSRAEAAAQAAKEAKAVEAAVLAAVREKKTLSDREKKDIVAKLRAEEQAAAKEKAAKEKAGKEAEAKAIREAEIKALREKEASRIEAEKKRRAEEAKIVAQAEQAARAEAEAKAKTEADRKAKAEAEKKAKAEAEVKATKAKAEAEEKAKAKAKAEAEAKAKAEEERLKKEEEEKEKLKAAAEAKVKEEKLKAEAEAKAKAEEEEKVKAAAEAKAKAEEEEKVKAAAGAKAKPEEEEKLKAGADARAKEEAEAEVAAEQEKSKEVQVVASGDVFAEKKETPKPFRWPWQKEPETQETVSEPEIQDAVAAETAQKRAGELPPTSKPLSPDPQLPDLKPPTSPTPSAPLVAAVDIEQKVEAVAEVVVDIVKGGADKAEEALIASSPEDEEASKAAAEELKRLASEAAAEAKKREEATLEKAKAIAAEAKKREEAALEKAKATTATFFWPWQKPKADNTSSAKTKQAMVSSSSTDLPRANRPLSPYTRYPGLRPLASPTPSPPVVSKAQSVADGFASSKG